MKHTLSTMLSWINEHIDSVPADHQAAVAPLIGAMNVGQVTSVDEPLRQVVHRTFVLFCPPLAEVY